MSGSPGLAGDLAPTPTLTPAPTLSQSQYMWLGPGNLPYPIHMQSFLASMRRCSRTPGCHTHQQWECSAGEEWVGVGEPRNRSRGAQCKIRLGTFQCSRGTRMRTPLQCTMLSPRYGGWGPPAQLPPPTLGSLVGYRGGGFPRGMRIWGQGKSCARGS